MISAMESTAELGHKTGSVFDRYNIVSETDLREAAKKLEQAQEKAELVEFRHTSDIVGGVPAPLRLRQNSISLVPSSIYPSLPGWRNWQTQRTQNPPGFGPWGFDSPSRHQS